MSAVIQRPLRGSRISTFYPVKNLPSLSSLDSAFQLQEYISLLIRLDVHDVDAIVSLPGSSSKDKDIKPQEEHAESSKEGEKDTEKAKNDVSVDESCWIYEQLRRLAQDLSHPLITTLQQECTRASCPEMKAGEWLYLCVAHGNDGAMEQCCAIDYILHTVDSATALLNSPRTFPSRLSIPQTSHRHFASLARRLGRIFAHAYFHHREAFEQAEAESSLYARFLALTAKFDLVPSEFLVIPPNQYTDDSRDRPASPKHGYHENRRQHQQENEDLPSGLREKNTQQNQADKWRNVNLGPTESNGTTSPNGGIGENPSSASRSRFGRNRTDTIIFAGAEATALADELASRARQGELEPDYERGAPETAKPLFESEKPVDEDEEEEEPDLDSETQFEISLSPDEEIPDNVDISTIPPIVEKDDTDTAIASGTIVSSEPSEENKPEERTVESEKKVGETILSISTNSVPVFGEFTPEAIAIAVASLSPPAILPLTPQQIPAEITSELEPNADSASVKPEAEASVKTEISIENDSVPSSTSSSLSSASIPESASVEDAAVIVAETKDLDVHESAISDDAFVESEQEEDSVESVEETNKGSLEEVKDDKKTASDAPIPPGDPVSVA